MSELGDRFRRHGRHTGGLYEVLLPLLAADLDRGGVTAQICRGWENSPREDFVQLRLLAGLHRLVLSGAAPELAEFYPSAGGTARPAAAALAWPRFARVLAAHEAVLRAGLDVAPQTNEPGRAAPLLAGLAYALGVSGFRRVRLLEVGASAGLNLLVDRYLIGGVVAPPGSIHHHRWQYGPRDSPVSLLDAVQGMLPGHALPPPRFEIDSRLGCDLEPIDATTTDGALRLTSFVWPHQAQRLARLRGALELARQSPAPVDRAAAGPWLQEQLSVAPAPDVLTVVWHSITRLYWPASERRDVSAAIRAAGDRMPLAHIWMEYPAVQADAAAELGVQLWTHARESCAPVVLGTVADHGVPVRLSPPP